jgi:uncharacterized protein
MSSPARQMRELDRSECLELLAETAFGRIAVNVANWAQPVIRPVNYVFDQRSQSVLFRSGIGSKLHALIHAAKVTFEIDGSNPAHRLGWSVIIHGVCEEITHPAELRRIDGLGLQPWAPGPKGHWIRIRAHTVSGRRLEVVPEREPGATAGVPPASASAGGQQEPTATSTATSSSTPNPTPVFPSTDVSVEEVMRPGVITCSPEDRLATLAAIMANHGIHSTVLEPVPGAAALIVTDLELLRAALQATDGARAAEIAREPASTVPSDVSLDAAVAIMAEQYVAHVLVTDPRSGAPVGVVSSFDVVSVLGGQQPRLARMLVPGPARPVPDARTLTQTTVRDVMHPGIATCTPEVPLWTVAQTMAEHHVRCVAVAGIDGAGGYGQRLTWGLIGDMDLVRARHRDALAEPAAPIARTAPIAVGEEDSLRHAAALMVEHGTRHVVVVGPSGLPSGIVSSLEVVSIVAAVMIES